MHDLLFARQHALAPADLTRYAGELGLDVDRFEENLRSGRFAARVGQDVNSAEEAGVAGTPSFFVNEVRYRGPYDLESMASTLSRVGSMAEGRSRLAEESG
jgi:predicted DsbA family dithiol-disulfide isomerase